MWLNFTRSPILMSSMSYTLQVCLLQVRSVCLWISFLETIIKLKWIIFTIVEKPNKCTNNLVKHLVVSLFQKSVCQEVFQNFVDKVIKRENEWKEYKISLVCKITLIQAILSLILIYIMQYARVPKGISFELDKVHRNFI